MNYKLLPTFVASVFLVTIGISGCSDKLTCWPFCSSSTSSGVDNDTPTDTTTDPVEVLTLDNDASSLTSVIVTRPNGGEVYRYLNPTAGGTALGRIRIRWGTGGSGTVIIDLYKSGKFHYRIHDNNDGYKQENEEYSWKPHPGLPSGTDYQIKVSAPNDSSIYDMSNSYFTISEPDS